MKYNIIPYFLLFSGIVFTGCNDYLDSEPITDVSTTVYLYAENDLAAYSANLYSLLPSHGTGYDLGLFAKDNGTDNQTADSPANIFITGMTHVGDAGNSWYTYAQNARTINYFLETVLPRYEQNSISGIADNISHYIGEIYFFRALNNFNALLTYGDFPILTSVLSDDYEEVRMASRRRPRNEVARFIIEDLNQAYNMMSSNPPMTNRLNRDCAALMKSRVGLYEGTWEKYHAGTAFVPKGDKWPGSTVDYLSDYTYNADAEINYFLSQALDGAEKAISSHPNLYGDYAALFNSVNLSNMDEVLLWREYSTASNVNITHNVVNYLQRDGAGNTGFTRSMVDSYLMADGLPIYASSNYEGDDSYEHLFARRDPRMDMTILKTGDLLSTGPNLVSYIKSDGYGYFYRPPLFEGQTENSNPTGYSLRKGLNTSGEMQVTRPSYTGCPVYRIAEAMLNYIEAYYELNGSLGGNCDAYWTALRNRAGVSPDYNATISATVMENEKADWGSYSKGVQIDPVLYNIRRERRIELAAEGFRLADLKRWRALDQVKNVHLQGVNFWGGISELYTNPQPEDAVSPLSVISLIPFGSGDNANISSPDDIYADGKYLLPYRKSTANTGFNGLNWTTANYLTPIMNREFRLTTAEQGSGDLESSTIYQNPGWTKEDGTLPTNE